jgi:hypothetical protein
VAASLALAVGAGVWAIFMRGEIESRDRRMAVLTAPDVRRVDLKGEGSAANASARAYWSPSRGFVFNAEGLPALDAAHVYQLWTIHNGKPVSAGQLRLDATGATHESAARRRRCRKPWRCRSSRPVRGSPTGAIVLVGKT